MDTGPIDVYEPLDEVDERLLLDIRARPDDDRPRLRYAAQVADRYPEHARLIVAQCGPQPDPGADPGAGRAYLASLPEPVREAAVSTMPLRGFLLQPDGYCWIDAEGFLRYHDALLRAAPTATGLWLTTAGRLAEIAALPALRRYRDLNLSESSLWTAAEAVALAGSAYLGQLRHLSVYGAGLGDEGLSALLGSAAYPHLASLDLGGRPDDQYWTLAGLQSLPQAAFVDRLRRLALGYRFMPDEVVNILAGLPALRELDLSGNQLTDAGMAGLAALPAPFTSLYLGSGGYSSAGVAALAAAEWLDGLIDLNLGAPGARLDGYATLLGSQRLAGLRTLTIEGGLGAGGLQGLGAVLAGSTATRHLHGLELPWCELGPSGIADLLGAAWPQLRRLTLTGNALGDHGVTALAESSVLAHLRHLDLSHNNISDAGIEALLASPHTAHDLYLTIDDRYRP